MITEEAISNRISQISQIVSAYTLPFNTGKDTKFLGKDIQVFAGIERAQLADDDKVVAVVGLEMYLGDYQYKKNIAIMDIADDYFDYNWEIRLHEIRKDFERIFYDLILTMLKDAIEMVKET